MNIPFVTFKPMEQELDTDIKAAFNRVYQSSWYIGGKENEEFEKAFASYCDVSDCVGVGNGLDALTISLKVLGIGEGDEVIVPANTFIATALAVSYAGAKPIFVDPDIKTFNIDCSKIERAITQNTRAIMAVHLYGQACNMERVLEIAKEYSLYVIEDCAQAHKEAMCKQVRNEQDAIYIAEEGKSCPTEIIEAIASLNAEGRPVWKPMHIQV